MKASKKKMPGLLLNDDALYVIPFDGRILCGRHAGASARFTGRDTSGQKVQRLTKTYLAGFVNEADVPRCETCAARARRNGGAA